jgi:hypothetical protein
MSERPNESVDDAHQLKEKPRAAITPELHALAREVVNVGRKDIPDLESSSYFLCTGRRRAREIGEQLHHLNGFEAMSAAHLVVRQQLGGIAAYELALAWDGIGDWIV